MKYISLLFVLFAMLQSCSSSKNSTNQDSMVDITITSTSNYCGGAKPPEDLIARLKEPKKYSGKEIIFSTTEQLGDGHKMLKTDDNGMISLSLEEGTYYLFLPEKLSAKLTTGGDADRCAQWKKTANGSFVVTKGMNAVDVNVHQTCNPCGAPRM